MDEREKAFQKRLLATFRVEAAEHVQAISSGLLRLERAAAPEERADVIESVFRAAHSLKGAARAVGLADIEAICQSAESVFAALKKQELELSPALSDVLHETADTIGRMLHTLDSDTAEGGGATVDALLARLDHAARHPSAPPPPSAGRAAAAAPGTARADPGDAPRREPRGAFVEEKNVLADTVRIGTAKLDALLYQAEELLSTKLVAAQRAADLRDAVGDIAALREQHAKITPAHKALQRELDRSGCHAREMGDTNLRRLLEFVSQQHDLIEAVNHTLAAIAKAAEHDQRALSGRIDTLLEDMKKALMLPFSSVLDVFPRLVRDLSREQHKETDLVIEGGEIEVDRRILETLRDPLVHLVRNSIDHGIERPEVRERANKPARATVRIAITPKEGGRIEVAVSDDGAGIDVAKLHQAAGRLGMTGGVEENDEAALLPLVFESGLSTSPIITELSGRGLGLAIVRENIERVGGNVTVESTAGRGTCFRLTLPLTLATYRGVHIRVNDQRFVVPSAHVEQVTRARKSAIRTLKNRETIEWQGEALALARLADVLELPRPPVPAAANDTIHLVILSAAGRRMAFEVDEVIAEQEVLIKPLGRQLARVRNIAGATVLGTGKAVPILHVGDLLQSAVNVASAGGARTSAAPATVSETKSILVAEDSITSRALLKNILETAGYRVTTAVDGSEAFGLLKTERFDLVVSDVEMPRLNGFDLTAKIRADSAVAETPVVLVTGLESREHRERGIDAGANAYVVKSSFDHSNLLDIVRRLV